LDIIPFPKGFVIVMGDSRDSKGNFKVTFKAFDFALNELTHITKSVYLLNKFGPAYKSIADQIGDYVSCAAGILPNKKVQIVYPTGEMGTFDVDGTLLWTGDLIYHDSPVRSAAVDDKYIWCTVPKHNSIIRYSPTLKKVDFRIGGEKSSVFGRPMSICKVDNNLYVCNKGSLNISCVNLDNFVVSEYKTFDEPVLRYFQTLNKEIVVLASGVYIL
ncbi:MAG: hypothetical protein RR343_05065, partial [Oscillospiraceae bacterium]